MAAPAVSAALDTPRAVTLSVSGLPAVSDSGNGRVRTIDSSAAIHTLAGLGYSSLGTLTLAAPAVIQYGTGAVTATLASSPATGSITFFDAAGTSEHPVTLGLAPLAGNIASDPTATLAAGLHHLTATYAGDATHASAASGVLALTVTPAPASAVVNAVSLLYGQAVPSLIGTLTGVLPQDAGSVALALTTPAMQRSPPGSYPIVATLSGVSAGNYTLTTSPAAVTIAKAPATLTLPSSLVAHAASTTSGSPTGSVSLFDGSVFYSSTPISAIGDAVFNSANLTAGSHTLTATYGGDVNFLATASSPLLLTIGGSATPDFTLAASGSSALTIPTGNAAAFSFTVTPVNGSLSSPILLTTSGLPLGATASFAPAYLPPSSTPTTFTLTIQTVKPARASAGQGPAALVLLLPLALLARRRRGCAAAIGLLALTLGCGDRVNQTAAVSPGSAAYNITVLATATTTAGATLQHTLPVTLTLQ